MLGGDTLIHDCGIIQTRIRHRVRESAGKLRDISHKEDLCAIGFVLVYRAILLNGIDEVCVIQHEAFGIQCYSVLKTSIIIGFTGIGLGLDIISLTVELRKYSVPLLVQTPLVFDAGGNGRSPSHSLGGICKGIQKQRFVF